MADESELDSAVDPRKAVGCQPVYFRQIREQCTTPIAMGELFNSPHEWQRLIQERPIGYLRCHVSQMGGFTPARKVALLAENYGVRTAWHAEVKDATGARSGLNGGWGDLRLADGTVIKQ